MSLKRQISEQQAQLQGVEEDNEELRKKMKLTKINEVEAEMEEYKKQTSHIYSYLQQVLASEKSTVSPKSKQQTLLSALGVRRVEWQNDSLSKKNSDLAFELK